MSIQKFMGVDVGRTHDSSSIVVVGVEDSPQEEPRLVVGYYEVWKGNLHQAAGHVHSVWAAEPLSGQAELLIDCRGMGQGIADILENIGVPFTGIMTTAGERENTYRSERGTPYFTVPKKNLVNAALVPYQQGRLRFLPGPNAERLKEELASFVPSQNQRTGHVRYEASAGEHDDIVFALLLCCWGARRLGSNLGVDETLSWAVAPYHGRSLAHDREDIVRDLPIDRGEFF
ncbi:MAG: hypothetical protein JO211_07315 [Acidobacteriaceae bacterium]|nr:hypothetical protein [Acidobacteriaceae bacterium]